MGSRGAQLTIGGARATPKPAPIARKRFDLLAKQITPAGRDSPGVDCP